MTLTKEQIKEIAKKYSTTIIDDDDIVNAFDFVEAVFRAEAKALNEVEPSATRDINSLDKTAHEVSMMCIDIEYEKLV